MNHDDDEDLQALHDEFLVSMAAAGTPPILMWTWIKTDLIPTEENRHRMPPAYRREVREAQAEYEAEQPDLEPYIQAARARLAST